MSVSIILACSSNSNVLVNKVNKNYQNSDNEDKILWSSKRKLTWDDFKGKPRENRGTIRAETVGEIITGKSYWENDVPKFVIQCYFLKNESWTVAFDTPTLEHEQIHFDIFEIHARLIRKSFDSLNKKKVIDFSVYENVFNGFLEQNRKCHDEYDYDVKFDRSKQKKWIEKTTNELEELKEYEYIPNDG